MVNEKYKFLKNSILYLLLLLMSFIIELIPIFFYYYFQMHPIVIELCRSLAAKELSTTPLDKCYREALNGFLLVLSDEGDVLFISDKVEQILGIHYVSIEEPVMRIVTCFIGNKPTTLLLCR